MKPALLLIIGPPASGKTTLANALTDTLSYAIEKKPFWHTIYYTGEGFPFGSQLGWKPEAGPNASFGGTDRLAFDVLPAALKWLKGRPHPMLLVEGDRLSNTRFVDGAMMAGYDIEIAEMRTPQGVLNSRRASRHQNEPWTRGRETKVAALSKVYDPFIVATLDGSKPVDELCRELAQHSRVAETFLRSR